MTKMKKDTYYRFVDNRRNRNCRRRYVSGVADKKTR